MVKVAYQAGGFFNGGEISPAEDGIEVFLFGVPAKFIPVFLAFGGYLGHLGESSGRALGLRVPPSSSPALFGEEEK